MEPAGDPPDPGGVDPSAAFFGLWPKFADPAAADRPRVLPLRRWTVTAPEPPRLRIA